MPQKGLLTKLPTPIACEVMAHLSLVAKSSSGEAILALQMTSQVGVSGVVVAGGVALFYCKRTRIL